MEGEMSNNEERQQFRKATGEERLSAGAEPKPPILHLGVFYFGLETRKETEE
jgi:hypothetical protein